MGIALRAAAYALLGAALFYHSAPLAGYWALLWGASHLFVTRYEEPTLRRTFGTDYEAYCSRVGRWWPRRRSEVDGAADAVRVALKTQYHAALRMLHRAIGQCPDDLWDSDVHRTRCWQLAYHTLYFAHLYMQPDEHAFRPWEHHQADVQYPDAIPGPPDPGSDLPLAPRPYAKEQVLAYCRFCQEMVDDTVDGLDVLSPVSGFSWYKVTKLEHQIVNIRHIQHGAAQLADRVRSAIDVGVDWVGASNGATAPGA